MFTIVACEKDEATNPSHSLDKAQTYEVAQQVLLKALDDPTVRAFIKTEALKTVTYDYEVVYGMVKNDAMTDGRSLEQAFLTAEESLYTEGRITSRIVATLDQTAPLLSINVPVNPFGWDVTNYAPPVVLHPELHDDTRSVEAVYSSGEIEFIDVDNKPNHTIITLADNERMLYMRGKYELDKELIMGIAPRQQTLLKNEPFECYMVNGEEICDTHPNPGPPPPTGGTNCDRDWNMIAYLEGMRLDNIGSLETFGRPELRMQVFGGNNNIYVSDPIGAGGQTLTDQLYIPDRNEINDTWYDQNAYLFRWYEAYGDIITFRWEEQDEGWFSGGEDGQTLNITVAWGNQSYSVTTQGIRFQASDYIGTITVDKNACERQYSVGVLDFRLRF
ncbi:hypothetical protein [Neolewinella maritima]|uniref:hypothetical protein n=1 Tax=Neolewinella maritima TaxID=1383882 RepID=UPI001EE922D2|nr:hypothetical protein [Neolewinella maritima]